MNGLDMVMLALLALALIIGYRRGFIAQIISLSGFLLAYLVAFWLYRDLAPILSQLFPVSVFESYAKYEFVVKGLHLDTYVFNALAFALLFFVVKLGLTVAGKVLHLIAKAPGLNFLNRWSGALLGLVEALLILVIAVNVMTIWPADSVQRLLSGSQLAPYCIDGFPAVAGKLQELWKEGSTTIKSI
ncbi:CvpA family protein [Paenibacillus athensensis]|uniref:CvpA family protein n=1 Tax=Paenibacillus athensensis TaxID=1967502 RepID=A0A4Y8PXV7_9BACL|nr:CvpA family protein [Paenibacillus athensensis]